MSTLLDIQSSLTDLSGSIVAISSELDVIQTKIDALKAGTVVSQADLDALGASVNAAKQAAADVLVKETAVAA